VTITGASNVTGLINPIYQAAALVHRYNSKICVDGAQLVPHIPVDMRHLGLDEHIDYMVFSAHKMYAPFGIGVLVGPKADFRDGEPDYVGGGTVKIVTHDTVMWEEPPHKEEAGSPNIMGVVALMAAIKTLKAIGMEKVEMQEKSLTGYTVERLQEIPGVKLYGNPLKNSDRVGIIPINIDGLHHSMVAEILSQEAGIAVRNGCFCAQPYIHKLLNISTKEVEKHLKNPSLPRPGMVRLSFGLYNDYDEVDILINTLSRIAEKKDYYRREYRKFE
jgi:selenocysteine lyase/cysteine desulfurase